MNTIQKIRSQKKQSYIVVSSLQEYSDQHIAQNFSIKYVDKGIERYKINGRNYDLCDQNYLIVSPGQKVEVEVKAKDAANVNGKCFFFDPSLISQIHYAQSNSTRRNLDHWDEDYINVAFQNIPVNIYGTGFETLLKSLALDGIRHEDQVTDILIALAEQLALHQQVMRKSLSRLDSDKKSTQLELYERIQSARQYLHDSLSEPISLNEIAIAANLSEYYFHRNFRKYFQMTPHQYLTRIRLDKAKSLVDKGQHTLKEIAFLCGFSDPKYFKKVFKKQYSVAS